MSITVLWNFDGIEVMLTGATMELDPCFIGVVTDDTRGGSWLWTATPKPQGYYMTYRRPGGSTRGSWTGATWNLGLEIAQGFKQVVGRMPRS